MSKRFTHHVKFGFMAFMMAVSFGGPAYAVCTNPAGDEGRLIYNGDYNTLQYCNGTGWIGLGAAEATTSLSNLTDTNVSPTDGQVLTWDNANGEWVAADTTSGWQVPDDAAVCNAGTDGTIRYNSNKLQVCVDGSDWTDVAGSGVTNGKFVDGTPTTTEAVYTAGNVGIGIADPETTLHVDGKTTTNSIIFDKVTGQPAPTPASSLWGGSGSNVFYTAGNVGIGTSSPASKLEVDGQIKHSGTLSDHARPICYSALTGNTDKSLIMIPLPASTTDLDAVCAAGVNSGWRAGGIAKGGYFTTDCTAPIDNLNYGGGYTAFVPKTRFESSPATYASCDTTNAIVCCSPQYPS